MARGDGQVAALEAVLDVVGAGDVGHPGIAPVVDVVPLPTGVLVSFQAVGHQVVDELVVGIDLDVIALVGLGEHRPYLGVDVLHYLGRELLFAETLRGGDGDGLVVGINAHRTQTAVNGETRIAIAIGFEITAERLLQLGTVVRGLGMGDGN